MKFIYISVHHQLMWWWNFVRFRWAKGLDPDLLTQIWLPIPAVMWQQHCRENKRGLSGPNSLEGLAVWLLTNDAVSALHSLTFYQLLYPLSVCWAQIGIITNNELIRRRATDTERENTGCDRVCLVLMEYANMNGERERKRNKKISQERMWMMI